MVSDISDFDIRSFEIFKDIIQNGPITAYSIKTEKKMAYATVHQHIKDMEKRNLIKIYDEQNHRSGQKKKLYGPTIDGIAGFCVVRPRFKNRLEFIFDKWKRFPKFIEELETLGFEINTIKNQEKAKEEFVRYMGFVINITNLAEKIQDIPFEEKTEMIITYYAIKKPEEFFNFIETFSHMPKMRNQMVEALKGQKVVLDEMISSFEKNTN